MSVDAPPALSRLERYRPAVIYGLLPALVIFAVAIAYWPALSVPFVYDDLAEIVSNKDLHDLMDPARVVGYNPARALLLLTFAAEWHLWADNPLPYHVTNLIIHLLNALAVALLTRRVLRGRAPQGSPAAMAASKLAWPPFAVALLFAVHPLFVETVTYIASRSSSLCALFYVSCVLSFSGFRDAQRAQRRAGLWYGLTLVFLGLAVATKEIAATLPGALILFDLALGPNKRSKKKKKGDGGDTAIEPTRGMLIWPHLTPWLILGGMLTLRITIAGSLIEGPLVRTIPQNLMTEAGVVLGYLYRFVVPYPLSIYHDVQTVYAADASTVGAIALNLGLIVGGLALLKRRSLWAFPLVWFFLTLSPSSSFIPLKEAMAEHRAYLPGMGLMTGLGLALVSIQRRGWATPSRWLVGIVAALFAGMTLSYNGAWATEIRLWQHATHLAPDSGDAFYALGDAYRRADRPDEAIEAYEKAIANYETRGLHQKIPGSTKIVYNYPDALNNLGLTYVMKGDLDRAIAQFRLAARAYPDLGGQAYTNLGYALILKGQHRAAEAALNNAVEVEPGNLLAHLHLANLYYAYLSNRARALEHYQAVLKIDPELPTREAIEARIVELSF